MPIRLEEERVSIPGFSLPNVGDQVVGMIIARDEMQMTDFATKAKLYKDDGKPQMQEVITVLVMAGTNALLGKLPAAEGDIGKMYVAKHHKWQYYEAKQQHGAIDVGDVIRWRITGLEPSSKGNAKKTSDFGLRKPKPDEVALGLVAKAEELHMKLRGTVSAEPTPVAAPATADLGF